MLYVICYTLYVICFFFFFLDLYHQKYVDAEINRSLFCFFLYIYVFHIVILKINMSQIIKIWRKQISLWKAEREQGLWKKSSRLSFHIGLWGSDKQSAQVSLAFILDLSQAYLHWSSPLLPPNSIWQSALLPLEFWGTGCARWVFSLHVTSCCPATNKRNFCRGGNRCRTASSSLPGSQFQEQFQIFSRRSLVFWGTPGALITEGRIWFPEWIHLPCSPLQVICAIQNRDIEPYMTK